MVDLGLDTLVGASWDNTFVLDAGTHATYLWSDGSTGQYLTAQCTGAWYSVTVSDNLCGTATDAVFVTHTTGIVMENTSDDQSNVYPNPTNGQIYVSNAKGASVSIYDGVGRLMFESVAGSDSVKNIDLSGYGDGLYFVRILKNNTVVTKKLVVKK